MPLKTTPSMHKMQPNIPTRSLLPVLRVLHVICGLALITGCRGAEPTGWADDDWTEETTTVHALPTTQTSEASTLYIDASLGADSNAGTAIAPWKTLARLTKVRMAKGQRIRLHCTGTWRETLNLAEHQLNDDVVIESYGKDCNGQRPRILGSNDFSDQWVREGALWWRSVPSDTPKIARLFVNGEPMQLARWPNSTATPSHSAVAETNSAPQFHQFTVSRRHRQALVGMDLAGAIVQIRTAPWRIDSVTAQAYDEVTGNMTLASGSTYAIPNFTDFILEGKAWMLDAPGEYLHDVQRQRIYLYPPLSMQQTWPNSARIEGSVRDHGAILSGRNNLIIRGINIEHARHTGLTVQAAPNAHLRDVQAHNNLITGIRLVAKATSLANETSPSVTLQDSIISGSSFYGVDAGSAGNARIVNNQIEDIGTRSESGNSFAAVLLGPASVAEGNRITNTAYIAIRFNGTGGSRLVNNRVEAFCTRLGDCAAIYTWNGPKEKRNLVDQRALIEGNTLIDTANRSPETTANGGWITAGIYLDDFSRGVTVRHNVAAKSPVGIYVHNGSNHTVESNQVWLTTRASIWSNMDQIDADYMTNNKFNNNELVPIALVKGEWPAPPFLETSQAIWYWQKLATYESIINSGGNQFKGNRVVLLNESTGRHIRVRGATFDSYLDSVAWQQLNPDETIASPERYTPYSLTLGPELLRGGSFDKGWGDWSKWLNPQGSGGFANHVQDAMGCNGGCITFASATPSDLIHSPSFNLKPGRPYRIAMDATFPAGGSIAKPEVSRKVSPWDSLTLPSTFSHLSRTQAVAGEKISYEGVFQATSDSEARLNIKLGKQGVATNIDNISLKEILTYSVHPTQNFSAILSTTSSAPLTARTVDCKTINWDLGCTMTNLYGKVIPLPIKMEPGESMIVLRKQ